MSECKDSNGKELKDGDTVLLTKDLKVKGTNLNIKRGTAVKRIRLTDSPEEIDCKINGSRIVLRTEYVKKKK